MIQKNPFFACHRLRGSSSSSNVLQLIIVIYTKQIALTNFPLFFLSLHDISLAWITTSAYASSGTSSFDYCLVCMSGIYICSSTYSLQLFTCIQEISLHYIHWISIATFIFHQQQFQQHQPIAFSFNGL